MRNFPLVNGINPRKDRGDPKVFYNMRKEMIPTFAKLASHLGFQSRQISDWTDLDTGLGEDEALVQYIWPLNQRICDVSFELTEPRGCPESLNTIVIGPSHCEVPSIVTVHGDERREGRCGRPFNRSYLRLSPGLRHLHSPE